MAAEDALIDQRTLAVKNTTAVDEVKVAFQEKKGVLRRRAANCSRRAMP
jgi:hypothetical protein